MPVFVFGLPNEMAVLQLQSAIGYFGDKFTLPYSKKLTNNYDPGNVLLYGVKEKQHHYYNTAFVNVCQA